MKRTYYNFQKSEPMYHLTSLSNDEIKDADHASLCLDDILSPIMSLPETTCTMIHPMKYDLFSELLAVAVELAANLCARLIIDEDIFTGCFTFIVDELNATHTSSPQFYILTSTADEISIKLSVDTGEHLPTDIDGMIQYEFWYDYHYETSV